MNAQMISDATALKNFLDGLPQSGTTPNLYVDLKSNNLSRNGILSIVTILVEPRHTVRLVDVHVLGKAAFTTTSTNGATLKQILESKSITKVFFDIRRDSDALYSLFGVSVAGIENLQLMELGSRRSSNKSVMGLAKCIEQDAPLSVAERKAWKAVKDSGIELFGPARGGSYTVFDQRPLSPEVEKYCAQDVIHMPALRQKYFGLLNKTWKAKVNTDTVARITLSQSAAFNTQGNDMAKGPEAWNPQSGDANCSISTISISMATTTTITTMTMTTTTGRITVLALTTLEWTVLCSQEDCHRLLCVSLAYSDWEWMRAP